jgi:RNA polymerase sigma factor (sigma-70 family)
MREADRAETVAMALTALNSVLQHLHEVADRRSGAALNDRQLLARFATAHDEAAFAEVVRRHGPLVWGVCRRLLPRLQDAEDVFQATFLVLARKAASVGWHESAAGWLHAAARRLALKARAEIVRRQVRERQARAPGRYEPSPDPSWREVGALLDEELHALPERLRVPLVLCYLEGRTRDEAARQLGWSLGTFKRRLQRGRRLLHDRLLRRGVTLSAVLLAGTLAPKRAPAALVGSTVRAAACGAAVRTGTALGVSARALDLAATHVLTVGRWKAVSALVLALGLLAGLVGPLAIQALTAPPDRDGPERSQPAAGPPAPAHAPARRFGGAKEEKTEAAIADGLQWLVRHQAPDGRWSLDHFESHGHCDCTGPGTHNDVAGTALGLLPLLGAGETQRGVGAYHPYAGNVRRGLRYLVQVEDAKGDFHQGMYAHGLATLTLCEAYGLTGDAELKEPAQRALDYIVDAQHPTNGGWRYAPRQPGDMSVTSWQVLALASGRRAGLKIPKETWQRVATFLDSVGTHDGSAYGYVSPTEGQMAMTAAGLYCRLQLGWPRNQPGLVKGVAWLQLHPPSTAIPNVYYYHIATRLMNQVGGKDWTRWEARLRQLLVDTQDRGTDPKHTHQKGSWSPEHDVFGKAGGRLMITSLSLILLETCARGDPPLPPPPRRELKSDAIEALWHDLASDDFPRARLAMRTLAADRGQAVAFLKGHLKPVAAPDDRRVAKRIAELDSDEFAVREKAMAELGGLGELAVPALRKALEGKPSLEACRRIEHLLEGVEAHESAPARLQALRAIEVLAQTGTPEARRVLQTLAGGTPQSGLTRAARAALVRPAGEQ